MKNNSNIVRKGMARRLFASIMAVCMVFTMTPPVTAAGVTDSGIVLLSGFAELPENIREQSVPLGVSLGELNLPDTMTATVGAASVDAEPEEPKDSGAATLPTEEQPTLGTSDEPASKAEIIEENDVPLAASPSDAENNKPEPTQPESMPPSATTSAAVTISGVTWESDPLYDSETEGTYIFTAVLPSGYTVEHGIAMPKITVVVGQAEQSAVDKVIAMIDALPTMDEWTAMDDAAARAVMNEILAAKKAYDALTAEEKAQIEVTRTAKLTELAEMAQQLANTMPMAGGDSLIFEADTPSVSGTGYEWVKETKTLTLNGYTSTSGGATGIQLPDGATLVINGTNSIIVAGAYGIASNASHVGNDGILCGSYGDPYNTATLGALTIEGNGTLEISCAYNGPQDMVSSWGLRAKSITMNGGTVTCTADKANESYGVLAEDGITINGGSLSGTGERTDESSNSSYGVYTETGNITVNSGGTLKGTGSTGMIMNDLTVDGGTVIGIGRGDASQNMGIVANNDLTIASGTITGTAEDCTGMSVGVGAANTLAVNSGTITATSGTVEADGMSIAVMAAAALTTGDGVVIKCNSGGNTGYTDEANFALVGGGAPGMVYEGADQTTIATDVKIYKASPTLDFATEGSTTPATGTGYAWVEGTKTLTLTDFNYTATDPVGIALPDGATLVLNGTNSVTAGDAAGINEESYGVYCLGTLTVSGTGSLVATAGIGGMSVGVMGNKGLIINSGTLTGIGKMSDGSWGVTVMLGDITVNGGALVGIGATDYSSSGVGAPEGTITVNGGSLTAKGGADEYSIGVMTKTLTLGTDVVAKCNIDTNSGYNDEANVALSAEWGNVYTVFEGADQTTPATDVKIYKALPPGLLDDPLTQEKVDRAFGAGNATLAGSTITLNSSVVVNNTIIFDGVTATLDLNGNTITGANGADSAITAGIGIDAVWLQNSANVTVDGTKAGSAIIGGKGGDHTNKGSAGSGGVAVGCGDENETAVQLTMKGGELRGGKGGVSERANYGGSGGDALVTFATTVTLTNVKLQGGNGGGYDGGGGHALNLYGDGGACSLNDVTAIGGTADADTHSDGSGVYCNGDAVTLTIKGGSYVGQYGLYIDSGNADVEICAGRFEMEGNSRKKASVGNQFGSTSVSSFISSTAGTTITKDGVPVTRESLTEPYYTETIIVYAPDPDIATVAAAKTAAENATYTATTQAATGTESQANTYVQGIATTAVNNSGVTVTVNKVSYTAPVAGDAADPDGTNGSYVFTVTVSKGAQSQTTVQKSLTITATPYTGVTDAEAVAAAKLAIIDGEVNVAFGAMQADKTSAVQTYVNGKLTGDAAGVTAIVTYNSSTSKYDVALSKGSVTDSKAISMTVTESADPDISIVTAAKTAAENATYTSTTQTATGTESAAQAYVQNIAATAVNNSGVTVTVNKVSYTAPVTGTSADPDGTDGSYVFTVTVSKGSQSQTTTQKTLNITAAAFTGVTDAEAVAAAKLVIIDGEVNVAFGATQADKTAAVQTYVNGKLSSVSDAAGVTATVTYNSGTGKYDVALSKGSVTDSKSITMTVNVAPDPDIATVTAAKTAAENATYTATTQTETGTESAANTYVQDIAKRAVNNSSVTVTINNVSYTAPVAGTSADPDGTDGSYVFTVTVSKGAQSQTTVKKTLTITATPYTPSAHKPVTGITGVPTTATASVSLPLTGTVNPSDATNKIIVWSVNSPGATGATISDSTLKTTAAGSVIVTATIRNGLTASTPYTQNFTITVSAAPATDNEKLAAVKAAIEAALANLAVSNATTAQDVLNVANGATSNGVTVAWDSTNGFTKTEATTGAAGSITGNLTLTLNGKTATVVVNKTIPQLSATTYTITASAAAGGSISPSGTVAVNMGDSKAFSISANSNYSISSVTVDGVNQGAISTYTFSNVTANHTISATFNYNGGGGGSTGGGTGGSGTSKPTEPVTGNAENKATVDNKGNANVSITEKNITDTIANAKAEADKKGVNAGEITAVIHVTTGGKDATTVSVNLPKVVQKQVIDSKIAKIELVIDRPDLTIGMNLAAVTEINKQANADVQITASKTNAAVLSADARAAIGSRPAYDLKATYQSGGKSVTNFGTGTVSIEIPYKLQSGETAGNIYAVYVDWNGKVTYLTNSSYDTKRETLVFSTNHFSVYGVGFKANAPKFTDIANHWAKDSIDFVVSRGLMSGTSNTTFAPDSAMTRGMFVTALGRLAKADVSGYKASTFSDVKADSYYMGYIEWANKNNIVVGVGEGKFAPDTLVTREQMAVIMDRYATAIGFKLPEVHAVNTFADNAKIGTWAAEAVKRIQMAGIITGKTNNVFDPQGTATRAEVSAVLKRFVELASFSDTAQGWTMNDSGKWMYYENGKAVTGKKTIGGVSYEFNTYGEIADAPKNLTYGTYTVKKGDSWWKIAREQKCNMFELARINGKNIFSIIYAGDVLKMPQQ